MTVRRMKAFALEARVPPTEIQLWNVGDNPTDYGIHKWTDRSQVEVLARYNERGNPLLVDVEHNGAKNEETGEPVETGGYARLELRDGAPWLVFEWSAYAVDQISTGQRRYLSPEYDVDADTNEVTKLYRVSLVADPGTYRARVLASAPNSKGTSNMDPTLAAIMAILSSVTDPAAAIEAIKGFVSSSAEGAAAGAGGEVAPVVADAPAPDAPKADAPPGDAPPKDKPAFAAADDDKEKTKAAAPIAASAPVVDDKSIKAARAIALEGENNLRDMILMRDGDRLVPSVRKWASSQSLAVVRGLCAAAPAEVTAPARIAATRGAGTGAVQAKGLEGEDLVKMQKAMGTYKAEAAAPHVREDGTFVLPTVAPSLHRERVRAAAAATAATAALAASKEGK